MKTKYFLYFNILFFTACQSTSHKKFVHYKKHTPTINKKLKTKLISKPLLVYDYYPKNNSICVTEKVKKIYFSISKNIKLKNLNCYLSSNNKIKISNSNGLVTVSLNYPLGKNLIYPAYTKEKLSCTAIYNKHYFWYNREFTIFTDPAKCSAIK